MKFNPYDSVNDWKQCCSTQLADAQRYYEKWQIDKMLEDIVISGGGVTSAEVETAIEKATSGKADTSYVEEIAQQVSANTTAILNTYTKEETNSLLTRYLTKLEAINMVSNYSKVEDTTLILNNENITI